MTGDASSGKSAEDPASAAGNRSNGDGESGTPDYIFYTFEDETFVPVRDVGELPKAESRPWTQQVRVVKAIPAGEDLYCAVNGVGVFIVPEVFSTSPQLQFKRISLSRIFSGRTVGSFFIYDAVLYCHLYTDSVLSPDTSPSQAVALVSINPKDNIPKIIPFSFQDRNPGWELALLSPQPGGVWSLAWKYSSEEKTMFRYSDLEVSNWNETELTEEEFLAKLAPFDGVSAPEGLKKAVQSVFDGKAELNTAGRGETPLVLDVTVQNGKTGTEKSYRFGPSGVLSRGEGRYGHLTCFTAGGTCYLLFPNGEIITVDSMGNEGKITLPRLPEEFVYTGFVTNGKKVIAFWEEQNFTLVGRAGICAADNIRIHGP